MTFASRAGVPRGWSSPFSIASWGPGPLHGSREFHREPARPGPSMRSEQQVEDQEAPDQHRVGPGAEIVVEVAETLPGDQARDPHGEVEILRQERATLDPHADVGADEAVDIPVEEEMFQDIRGVEEE